MDPLPSASSLNNSVTWKEQLNRVRCQVKQAAKLLAPSARFLTTCEAHTYAYSVAANAILALIPFLVLLITAANLMDSRPAERMIYQITAEYLPAGAAELQQDLARLTTRHSVQIFSLIMLAISASGVFLPFEVALNGVWGFKKNRSYLGNQWISIVLLAACGVLAYVDVMLSAVFKAVLVDPIHVHWISTVLNFVVIKAFAVPTTVLSFWVVFWLLPNGKVPVLQVFPAALYTGVLAEVLKVVFGWALPLLEFQAVYGRVFWIPVTLLVWAYTLALLLLFGASLSANGQIKLPRLRLHRQITEEASADTATAAGQVK